MLVFVNGMVSRVITFGDPFQRGVIEVIVIITGTPGIPDFYTEFAQELYRCTRLPVCIIGHAGQDVIDKAKDIKVNDLNLDNQIKHKEEIIKLFDSNSKLHLIGHSMGAWMLLELIHKNHDLIERTHSINLLFPTIQKFSETPNGKFLNFTLRKFFGIIIFFLYIIQWLPSFFSMFLIKLYCLIVSWPCHYFKRLTIYLDPLVQKRSMTLACESMHRITELNTKSIDKVKHLTNVVYAVDDQWVPMHHIEDLKKFVPHITFVEVSVAHAFVLKSSVLVGKTVGDLIKKRVKS